MLTVSSIGRFLFRLIVHHNRPHWVYRLAGCLFTYSLVEIGPCQASIRSAIKHKDDYRLTILVLSYSEFRSDIDIIAENKTLRTLYISGFWQSRLFSAFYPTGHKKYGIYSNPDNINYPYSNQRNAYRHFLRIFLGTLYSLQGVDCVISPHHRLIGDMDWGAVSTHLGIPHILLPRDSQFAASDYLFERTRKLFNDNLPKFEGARIIVQSQLDIPIYTKTGYVTQSRLRALGCPRMDNFLKKYGNSTETSRNNRSRIIVYLPIKITHMDYEEHEIILLNDFQEIVFRVLIKLSLSHPEYEIVVKPKEKLGGVPSSSDIRNNLFKDVIERIAREYGTNISEQPNFVVSANIDLHTLFSKSSVVCGLNTSALLEAAAINVRVVIPYFSELESSKLNSKLFFAKYFDAFDVAKNPEQLVRMLTHDVLSLAEREEKLKKQKALFSQFISNLDATATDRYTSEILATIEEYQTVALRKL